MPKNTPTKTYLGDSVYADWDGFAMSIFTDNGHGPTNLIFLEVETVDALIKYWNQIHEESGVKPPYRKN